MIDATMLPEAGDASGDVVTVAVDEPKRPGRRADGALSQSPAAVRARKRRKDAGRKRKRAPRQAPDLPGDDEIPAGLRSAPGAKDRAPQRPKSPAAATRELRDQLTWLLGLFNTGFLTFAPCSCDATRYEGITAQLIAAGAAHIDTCPRMWALDAGETDQLVSAIADELQLHPEWGEQLLSAASRWQPHIALAVAIGTIAISRAQRQGNVIPLVDKLSDEQRAIVDEAIANAVVPPAPPTPEPVFHNNRAAFTEAAAAPFDA